VEDLAKRLEALLADPAGVARRGARAAAHVCRHYSWDRATDALEALYRSLVAGAPQLTAGSMPSSPFLAAGGAVAWRR
jgi:hypothetical protein